MIYLIVYGLLFFIGIYDIRKNGLPDKRKSNNLLNLMIVILTLFRGLRWETGTDWDQFLEVFQYVDKSNAIFFIRSTGEILEPGYTLLNFLVKCISDYYTSFLLLSNLIILICYKYFSINIIQRYQCLTFIMIIITYQFFPVRQNIAGAILMVATIFFLKNRYKKFILLTIIAFLFHKSVLIIIPLILFSRLKIKNSLYLIAYLVIPFLHSSSLNNAIIKLSPYISLISEDFDTAITNYMNYGIDAVSFSYGSYMLYLIFLLVFSKIKNIADKTEIKEHYNLIFNLFFINIWGMKIAQATGIFGLIRLFSYFDYCINILVCLTIFLYSKHIIKVIKRSVIIPICCFIFFFGFFFNRSARSYSNLIFPYYSIFDSNYHRSGNTELKNTEENLLELILK